MAAATMAGALLLSACGSTDTPADDPSTSPSPSATSESPSAAPGTDAPVTSPVSTGNPGVLELVTADEARISGRCRPQPRAGLVCAGPRKALRFQPESVRRARVVAVGATGQAGDCVVTIRFGPVGSRVLTRVTRTAAATRETVVVMVPDSRKVILAASVAQPIRGGNVQVSDRYSRSQAARIVNLVTKTAG
jgi:hypothetical protein